MEKAALEEANNEDNDGGAGDSLIIDNTEAKSRAQEKQKKLLE